MKSFKQILKESKNSHLVHLEDTFLDWTNISGLDTSITFLENIGKNLSGKSNKTLISSKIDGSPAVVCGINPENKKFFVGTKAVFNKVPKLNYTNADIDENHSGELGEILKYCLKHLSKLNIKTIYQGDLLFIPSHKKSRTIDGVKYITFKPNTIMYAIPEDSDLAKTVDRAKIGIVFHTEYASIINPSAKFNIKLNLRSSPDVWFTDAYFKDVSGNINFTKTETQGFNKEISELKKLTSRINKTDANILLKNRALIDPIKKFNNSRVREGEFISNPEQHVTKLIAWLAISINKEIESLKTDSGKEIKQKKFNELLEYIDDNKNLLVLLFEVQSKIVKIKNMVVKKLEAGKHLDSFIQTDDGFEYTGPEGFVAVDSAGTAVKLVDRLVFSKNNFNAVKNWK